MLKQLIDRVILSNIPDSKKILGCLPKKKHYISHYEKCQTGRKINWGKRHERTERNDRKHTLKTAA
jgi:hypothetical protein